MRALVLSMVVVFGFSGAPVTAQTLDLSTIKCRDSVASSKESIGLILAWLNAYYKDEDAPPILDFGQFTLRASGLIAAPIPKPV